MDIDAYFEESAKTLTAMKSHKKLIENIAKECIRCLQANGTIFWCGNGGSAADSQHLAAELIGRFKLNRQPLRSIALTTDSSVLTATANDFGYENVFSRQLEGLGKKGDVLVGISTSGLSPNVIGALKTGKRMGIVSVLLTGSDAFPEKSLVDYELNVPSSETSHIQEAHIAVGQLLCGIVEENFFGKSTSHD
jgi:D-sedoheptulose 7-phosphate isomerase